jgi:peptidyl-dipeptidase Dcp
MITPAPESPNASNPFFQKWDTPFGVPPFDRIRPEHYLPAFQAGIRRHNDEIKAILKTHAAPTFQNTVEALEDSGVFLDRVRGVFSALVDADTNEQLQAVALAVGPLLSGHQDDILFNDQLFRRVQCVREGSPSALGPEARTLLEKTFNQFKRGGAGLPPERQARLRAVHAELALLCSRFEENLLKETNAFALVVDRLEDLEGLPGRDLAAAQEAAKMADQDGKWVFTLRDPSLWPFLAHARNRELRRRIFQAYTSRCSRGNAQDNTGVASRIAALRCEKARLLGFPTYAHYALADHMAGTPAQAAELMDRLWKPALARARREAETLQTLLEKDLPGARLEPWDWLYYAEQVKNLDADELRPYFPLEQVRTGAFRTANRLYGITFNERKDIPTYHPEVRTFLVQDRDGSFLGIYFADYHTRPGKRGGAWMETFRRQGVLEGKDLRPLVYNVTNFPRPLGNVPALLRLEEVRTLFHEFGHALHALLSRCRYRSLSGVSAALDFAEMPSQIMENWATEPEVMALYACHYQSGASLPVGLAARIQRSHHLNQGFSTTEFLASAYLDLARHSLTDPSPVDAMALEARTMERIGLIPQIVQRYRTPYFSHSMDGEYAASYYGYIWSGVLDADAFEAFREKGDLFDPATARAFRLHILEKGGSEDPMVLFKRFRGREPDVEPLLRKRGLM